MIDVDNVLTWIRQGRDVTDDITGEFKVIDQLRPIDQLLPKKKRETPQDRAEDIEGVLCWLRENNMTLTDDHEPTDFNEIENNLMPNMRSPEDRAKDLDDALTWVRHKDSADNPELQPFKTLDQLLPSNPGRSPEDRAQEIE